MITGASVPDFTIHPQGPFVLASAARFIAGWPPMDRDREPDAAVRLGFLADDLSGHAGVVLTQDTEGAVHGEIVAGDAADADVVAAQAARILSLDHDATTWPEVGERVPELGALQTASDWLRPVLFHSPYEATCWAIVSARTPHARAAAIRRRLAGEHGTILDVAGERLPGFPKPERLLALREDRDLSEEKLRRLHGVAEAAEAGVLDRDTLLALGPEQAAARLRQLRGIGPFWADLVVLRAVGPPDALALTEPRLRAAAAKVFHAPDVEHDDDAFTALADTWRPWRTWAALLLRSLGMRT